MRFIQIIMVTTRAAAKSIISPSKPSSLTCHCWRRIGRENAAARRGSNHAEPYVGSERATARAIQIDEDDADHEGGFDTFTKSDKEGREHVFASCKWITTGNPSLAPCCLSVKGGDDR